ncbi:MAG: hypothetical protein IJC78_03275 [Clostridia bacterium]|nr:hypothetical protein [Clostridia bacterium]
MPCKHCENRSPYFYCNKKRCFVTTAEMWNICLETEDEAYCTLCAADGYIEDACVVGGDTRTDNVELGAIRYFFRTYMSENEARKAKLSAYRETTSRIADIIRQENFDTIYRFLYDETIKSITHHILNEAYDEAYEAFCEMKEAMESEYMKK